MGMSLQDAKQRNNLHSSSNVSCSLGVLGFFLLVVVFPVKIAKVLPSFTENKLLIESSSPLVLIRPSCGYHPQN